MKSHVKWNAAINSLLLLLLLLLLCGSVPRVRYLKHRNNETTTKTYEKLQKTSGISCRNLDASPVSDKNLKINN